MNNKHYYIITEFTDDTAQDGQTLEHHIYVNKNDAYNELHQLAFNHTQSCFDIELPFYCDETVLKFDKSKKNVIGLIYNNQFIPLNNYILVKYKHGCYCLGKSHHKENINDQLCEHIPLFEELEKYNFSGRPCRYPYFLSLDVKPHKTTGKIMHLKSL